MLDFKKMMKGQGAVIIKQHTVIRNLDSILPMVLSVCGGKSCLLEFQAPPKPSVFNQKCRMADWFKPLTYFHCQFIFHHQLNLWIDMVTMIYADRTISSISNTRTGLSHNHKEEAGIWMAWRRIYFTVCVALPSSLPFTAGKLRSCVFHRSADIDFILKVIHGTSQSSLGWSHTSKQLQISLFACIKLELKPEIQTLWCFPIKWKRETSQEDANHLVLRLLRLLGSSLFQNTQPCVHSAVYSCNCLFSQQLR